MVSANALRIAADHPAFAGHFPERPLLPGVVLLDAALRQLSDCVLTPAHLWQIVTAKFHRPVGPGTELWLQHESMPDGSVRFTISTEATTHTAAQIVASGLLRPPLPPRPSAS